MNTFRRLALLASVVLALPLGAHAAMDSETHKTFIKECTDAAAQNQQIDAKAAQAYCTCGENSLNKHFSDAEIKALNDRQTPPDIKLTTRVQNVIAQDCPQAKK